MEEQAKGLSGAVVSIHSRSHQLLLPSSSWCVYQCSVAAVPNDCTPRGLQLHSLYCLTVLSHKSDMGLPD